jgi:hypothetical protein
MKNARLILPMAAVLGVFACSGEKAASSAERGSPLETESGDRELLSGRPFAAEYSGVSGACPGLEEIAEIERAGGYYPGLGLAESGLRERAGDYAGAVIAAYKDLSWAYGYGSVKRSDGEEGLRQVEALFKSSGGGDKRAAAAVRGVLAFSEERWDDAEGFLKSVVLADDEPDSFLRWMLLVCALEKTGGAAVRSVYSSIRARYVLFPEYWYRGARAFPNGSDGRKETAGNMAAEYAEQCINLSSQGPFARDCRRIIAARLGLDTGAEALRSKAEIEDLIRRSVASGNPEILEDLFPLMNLPDNAYTLYALGALRAISSVSSFREFFTRRAVKAPGRLAERFNFILRG